jgi:hypothetical protein
MNIPEVWQEIKTFADRAIGDWGLFAVVILVALGSFGLGRLSALMEARPLIQLKEAPQEATILPLHMGGLYVASWSGSVYYYPWCDGAQKILPQNQRWFTSEAAARSAGYTPAKACKGLTP